uniref:uncharacterized protein isoform X2 n=1 Tax=Myxine glutinosa TaxID=7769 RepID=UPI00358EF1B0
MACIAAVACPSRAGGALQGTGSVGNIGTTTATSMTSTGVSDAGSWRDPRTDFSGWLTALGASPGLAGTLRRELGIGDFETLRASAANLPRRHQLLLAARRRLPQATCATLRRALAACGPPAEGLAASPPLLADVLEALVLTLTGLSRELLSAAHRFSSLEAGLYATGETSGSFVSTEGQGFEEGTNTNNFDGQPTFDGGLDGYSGSHSAAGLDGSVYGEGHSYEGASGGYTELTGEQEMDGGLDGGTVYTEETEAVEAESEGQAEATGGTEVTMKEVLRLGMNNQETHLLNAEPCSFCISKTMGRGKSETKACCVAGPVFASDSASFLPVEDQGEGRLRAQPQRRARRSERGRRTGSIWPREEDPCGEAVEPRAWGSDDVKMESNNVQEMNSAAVCVATYERVMEIPRQSGQDVKAESGVTEHVDASESGAEHQMAVAWSGEGTTAAGADVVVSTDTEVAMAAENRSLAAVTTLSAPTVTDSHVYCSDCGVGFAYRSLLLAHRRRHTGEKPFACELCGRRFSLSHNLARHRRIHTGETYACTECGKRFSRAYLLSHHKRTHLHL